MPSYEPREARRRGVRLMLRLGVLMLARSAEDLVARTTVPLEGRHFRR